MQVITITGTTGIGPYDIYLCDITLTYCYLISGSTTIPPNVEIVLPPIFTPIDSVIVKIIDTSNGCEIFHIETCPPSPTPTPTITPTPTPTMIINCNCIEFENTSGVTLNYQYIDCSDNLQVGNISAGLTLYFCGKLPSADVGINVTIGSPCFGGLCV